jgi:hypothetical protein
MSGPIIIVILTLAWCWWMSDLFDELSRVEPKQEEHYDQ